MDLWKKLKIAAIGRGLTMVELARKTGVCRQTLYFFGHGQRRLSLKKKERLIAVLGLPKDFFEGSDS